MAQQIEQLGGEAIVVGANLGKVRRGCVCCCRLQQLLAGWLWAGWRQVWLRVGLESQTQAHCGHVCSHVPADWGWPLAQGSCLHWLISPLPHPSCAGERQ